MSDKCKFCEEHEYEDTIWEMYEPDGGFMFDRVRDIKYCPLCGKKLLTYEEKYQHQPVKKTSAEAIREMNDKEMAIFFTKFGNAAQYVNGNLIYKEEPDQMYDWLNEDVSSNTYTFNPDIACPKCGSTHYVIKSHWAEDENCRMIECKDCGHYVTFNTKEYASEEDALFKAQLKFMKYNSSST